MPVESPFVVIVDRQEKAPWTFQGIRDRGRRVKVRRTWRTLKTGDYAVEGMPGVVIERKSLGDLYKTLGQGRERFEREHERMAELEFAAVVIESDWVDILEGTKRSGLHPNSVLGTAVAWSTRYGVHWIALRGRELAERYAYRLLERCWKERRGDAGRASKGSGPRTLA